MCVYHIQRKPKHLASIMGMNSKCRENTKAHDDKSGTMTCVGWLHVPLSSGTTTWHMGYNRTSETQNGKGQGGPCKPECMQIYTTCKAYTDCHLTCFSLFTTHLFEFPLWKSSAVSQFTAPSSGWLKSCISSSSLPCAASFPNSWGSWDPKTLSSSIYTLLSRPCSISASTTSWEPTRHKNW